MSRIAVVGGGISSLTFVATLLSKLSASKVEMSKALSLSQSFRTIDIQLFEPNAKLGGRASSVLLQTQDSKVSADVGANFLDYESEEEKNYLSQVLPKQLLKGFNPFQGRFLLYKKKLQEPKPPKQRYFYDGGFDQLSQDLYDFAGSCLQGSKFRVYHQRIASVSLANDQWVLRSQNNQQFKGYDFLVLGCPAPISAQLLKNCPNSQLLQKTAQKLSHVEYSEQLSATFQISCGKRDSYTPQEKPYSVLVFEHHITFLCFHDQKHPSKSKQKTRVVIQMNEQFTKKHKNSFSDSQYPKVLGQECRHQKLKVIENEILQLVPQEIQEKFGVTPENAQCIGVHYWDRSLIQPNKEIDSQEKYFESFNGHELLEKSKLAFVGDFLNNKSRVTSAMKIGAKTAEVLEKLLTSGLNQHSNGDSRL